MPWSRIRTTPTSIVPPSMTRAEPTILAGSASVGAADKAASSISTTRIMASD